MAFLDDQSELTSIFQLGRMAPADATAVLEAATSLSLSLGEMDLTQLRKALQTYVTRVQIADTTIAVTLSLTELHHVLSLPAVKSNERQTHTIVTSVRVTKRGVEQRLVIGRGVMTPVKRDETLVKALARAYSWFEDIRTGRIADLSEIATREKLPRSYVQAHLPLAFLAPKIVRAILDGKQPADAVVKAAHVSDRSAGGLGESDELAWVRRLIPAALEIPASAARNTAKLPARNRPPETRATITGRKSRLETMSSPVGQRQ